MHDYKGLLSEATGANLFLLIGGELHTPTTETILNGITRQDWDKLGNYSSQGDRQWDGTLTERVRSRKN